MSNTYFKVASRADILKITRLVFIIYVVVTAANFYLEVMYQKNMVGLIGDNSIPPEFQLSLSFYVRAFLSNLFDYIPKIFFGAIIFSGLHVLTVFFFRKKVSDPLVGSEYLGSFVYFIKKFIALGLISASLVLLFVLGAKVLSFYLL